MLPGAPRRCRRPSWLPSVPAWGRQPSQRSDRLKANLLHEKAIKQAPPPRRLILLVFNPYQPRRPLQAKLDALDQGKHFVNNSWHTWEDPEEGGAAKPSVVLQ